ncbi:hypothetical protein [Nostoc sp.]
MNRSKIIAILTGAISIILAIAYLILVQLLDYRDMKPAPISQFDQGLSGRARLLNVEYVVQESRNSLKKNSEVRI